MASLLNSQFSPCHEHLNYAAMPERPLQQITCLRTWHATLLAPVSRVATSDVLGSSASVHSHRRRQQHCQRAQPANRSWGGELPDWEIEPYSSTEEIEDDLEASVLGSDDDGGGGAEFAFQNVLAAVLIGALALSLGNVLLKLCIVAAALISAAFRYSAIGFLIIVILALFS